MLNRRGFLATLAAGLTLDPERALWVPGRKLISLSRKRYGYKRTGYFPPGCDCRHCKLESKCPTVATLFGKQMTFPIWLRLVGN